MKTELLLAIVLTTMLFLSLGTGTSLAVPPLPDDIKIVTEKILTPLLKSIDALENER